MSAEFSIRPAVRADINGLLAMISRLAAHHGDVATVSEADLLRDLFGLEPWCHALVAESSSGDLAGYAVLSPLIQIQYGRRGMDMHHLFVEQAHRGKGLGNLLISASMKLARQFGCAYLAVGTLPGNLEAQSFYESAGFARSSNSGPRFRIEIN